MTSQKSPNLVTLDESQESKKRTNIEKEREEDTGRQGNIHCPLNAKIQIQLIEKNDWNDAVDENISIFVVSIVDVFDV